MQIPRTIVFGIAIASACVGFNMKAGDHEVNWEAGVTGAAGNNDFAPYYIASNRHGVITQSKSAIVRGHIWHDMDTASRFSYGYGADLIAGYGSNVDYLRYDGNDNVWAQNPQHPSPFWIQQLYGEVKYRGVFLTVGLKEHGSALLNNELNSGDFVESVNARPIPEVRAGFIDFQDIPFTKGWVQIQGELSYGKFTDNAWMRNHFNYYGGHLNQGALYTYKRCYFRTKPSKPFSVTVGMQVGSMFGGNTDYYSAGKIYMSKELSKSFSQFFKMLIPKDEGKEYVSGSALGCWDIHMRYRLRNGMEIKAYLQKPWEDGSGIGFLNGFDGLWGLEFSANRRAIVSGAVVEYLDFTNQSGPFHWDPDDFSNTTITGRAEGGDNYYNNHEYNGYQYYGMSIGTPFLRSPIYNQNGIMEFTNNLVRGFHIGIKGEVGKEFSYRVLGGYRRSWGTPFMPLLNPASDTSMMFEGTYNVSRVPGLSVNAQIAFDHGELYGDNIGACLTVKYRGLLKL